MAGLRGAAKGLREIDMPKTANQMDGAADAIEELLARIQKLEYVIRLLRIEKETFKTFSGL